MLVTGNQLRAARALAGLSQIDLARAAGVNVTTISAMERKGATSLTSGVDTALKIALALEGSGVELIAVGGRPGVRPLTLTGMDPGVLTGMDPPHAA